MSDDFFTKTNCDRCNKPLTSRTMSWFTEDTICMTCSAKESEIKTQLVIDGKGTMEGCGFVPALNDIRI